MERGAGSLTGATSLPGRVGPSLVPTTQTGLASRPTWAPVAAAEQCKQGVGVQAAPRPIPAVRSGTRDGCGLSALPCPRLSCMEAPPFQLGTLERETKNVTSGESGNDELRQCFHCTNDNLLVKQKSFLDRDHLQTPPVFQTALVWLRSAAAS